MSLPLKKFMHTPLYVDAIQVTSENMLEVAKWVGGSVVSTFHPGSTGSVDYIRVEVIRPQHIRQTQAFVNDWVLTTGLGFKVFTPAAFEKTFTEVTTPMNDAGQNLVKAIFEKDEAPADFLYRGGPKEGDISEKEALMMNQMARRTDV